MFMLDQEVYKTIGDFIRDALKKNPSPEMVAAIAELVDVTWKPMVLNSSTRDMRVTIENPKHRR